MTRGESNFDIICRLVCGSIVQQSSKLERLASVIILSSTMFEILKKDVTSVSVDLDAHFLPHTDSYTEKQVIYFFRRLQSRDKTRAFSTNRRSSGATSCKDTCPIKKRMLPAKEGGGL